MGYAARWCSTVRSVRSRSSIAARTQKNDSDAYKYYGETHDTTKNEKHTLWVQHRCPACQYRPRYPWKEPIYQPENNSKDDETCTDDATIRPMRSHSDTSDESALLFSFSYREPKIFEVAHFSPGGTASNSLGRQPQESGPTNPSQPRRATP